MQPRSRQPWTRRRTFHPHIRRVRLARRDTTEIHGHGRGLKARAGERAGVGARYGDGRVLLLTRRGGDVFLDLLGAGGGRLEAVLSGLRCGLLDADRGWLEGERLWLGGGLMLLRVLRAVVLAVLRGRVRVLDAVGEGGGHGRLGEAGGVWCRLAAELGEVEVGAGAVADVHGLAELALAVEAVEDDAVDDDGDGFHDDFDDGADEGPVLYGA